jgi:hypothetical protein
MTNSQILLSAAANGKFMREKNFLIVGGLIFLREETFLILRAEMVNCSGTDLQSRINFLFNC